MPLRLQFCFRASWISNCTVSTEYCGTKRWDDDLIFRTSLLDYPFGRLSYAGAQLDRFQRRTRMSVNVPWLLSLLFVGSLCLAQTPGPNSSSSISGRVTIGGKSAAGITVTATLNNSPMDNRTVAKTTTDDDGNYHLAGLAAGRFTITPIAKAFVVAAGDTFKQPGQTVNVAENESITKIDFALVRGGVITGRITDLEGGPIIGEVVNIAAKGDSGDARATSMFPTRKNQTDDRGVYRIYGLGPGTYKVSVGQGTSGAGGANILGTQYAKTF